jgi:hypothetical protein
VKRWGAIVAAVGVAMGLSGCGTTTTNEVTCEAGDTLVLSAQAVPDATMLPCITAFPTGWTFGGYLAETDRVRYWMDADSGGTHAVEVELSDGCDTSGTVAKGPDEGLGGVERFEQADAADPPSGAIYFTFPGGCVTLRYDFADGAGPEQVAQVAGSLMLVPRTLLVAKMADDRDLVLCGAGAPDCP